MIVPLPDVDDPGLRLLLLARLADTSYAEIERQQGLPRGKLSAVARGDLRPYPKLRRLVSAYLAEALDLTVGEVTAYLFPTKRAARRPPVSHHPNTFPTTENNANRTRANGERPTG